MGDDAMNRRAALGLMAATGAGAALAGLPAGAGAAEVAAHRLARLFRDGEAARAIGRAYLSRAPEEADAGTLFARLAADDPQAAHALSSTDTEGARAWLRGRVRADFAAGRTADVAGWRLARTEARAMALLALA